MRGFLFKMSNAKRDENRVPTLLGVSKIDGESVVIAKANPSTGGLVVEGDVNITNTLITVPFDYISATYPDTSTEVYTYKLGGSSGTTVGTITVVYSDAGTKQIISSVTKS